MTVCAVHATNTYLRMNIDRHLKFIMTRFRLGISDIVVHRYRHKNIGHRFCPMFPCAKSFKGAIRTDKIIQSPSLFRLSLLLASNNENIVKNLSVYLYKSFKWRSILIFELKSFVVLSSHFKYTAVSLLVFFFIKVCLIIVYRYVL